MRNVPQRVGKSAEATCCMSLSLTSSIIAAGGEFALPLTSRLEGEDGVLLRRDGCAVAGCGMKMPIVQRRQALVIDIRPQALQYSFTDDLAALIDGDFNDLVARGRRQLPRVDRRIRSRDGESRTNLVPGKSAAAQRSIRKTSLCAVAQGGKSLSLRVIFRIGAGPGILRGWQSRGLGRCLPVYLFVAEPLMTVALRSRIGRALAAVVGRLTGPVE